LYRVFFILVLFIGYIVPLLSQQEKLVSIDFKHISKHAALIQLSEETEVSILFSADFFDAIIINKRYREQSVEFILSDILEGSGVSFKRNNQSFVLFKERLRYYQLYGYLMDDDSGETLPYASIYSAAQELHVFSNEHGYYNISLPEGDNMLVLSSLGYARTEIIINVSDKFNKDLKLKRDNVLPEIIVQDVVEENIIAERLRYSHSDLMKLSKETPGIGGASDLLHTAKSIAGIQTGGGGIGGYFVRGGSNSQNLFLLDGVTIYNPFHLLGLTSIFSPNATKSLRIYKSGFRSQYGDRTASVVDIKVKDGNLYKPHVEVGFNPQDYNLTIETPILKGQSSVFFYGRKSSFLRSFKSVIKESISQLPGTDLQLNYHDILCKVQTKIGDKNKLILSYYRGEDNIDSKQVSANFDLNLNYQNDISWGNEVFSGRLESQINPNLYLHISGHINQYDNNQEDFFSAGFSGDEMSLFYTKYASSNRDIEFKIDADYYLNNRLSLKAGASFLAHNLKPEYSSFMDIEELLDTEEDLNINSFDTLSTGLDLDANKAVAYSEITYQDANWNIKGGLRYTNYSHDIYNFQHVQPRLNINYLLKDKNSLTFSLAKTVQYNHLLSSSEVNLPRDIWFPSNDELLPEETIHLNLGYAHAVSKDISLLTEVYHKKTNNRNESTNIDPLAALAYEALFTSRGSSESYGVELTSAIKKRRWHAAISYTWSRSTLQFDDINQGLKYSHQFEREHQFKGVSTYYLSSQLTLGFNVHLSSGHPLLITESFDPTNGITPIDINPLGQKNITLSSLEHRFDFSALYQFSSGHLDHAIKCNLYNVYNNSIPLFYTINTDVDDNLFS